jgi:TM2 domain-containing membrane protein YozV
MTIQEYEYDAPHDVYVRRAPSPGLAAVFSVVIPGLGQVYNGRLIPGALWFLGTAIAYSAVLLPGFLIHAACVWCAYQGGEEWHRSRS